ncbi:MAG TPA: hypothetical protein VFV66_12350 [Nonomuraea sp.]|nr:hypothetical protein [Nonomuraea sp.]
MTPAGPRTATVVGASLTAAGLADPINGYRWALGCMAAVAAPNVVTRLGRRRAWRR